MNVLAGRTASTKGLKLTGEVQVNNTRVHNWDSYRNRVAFVEQDDLLFHTLTVKETLVLAAHLRLPREFTHAQRMEKVDEVVSELGLRKCVDTRIGNAKTRGVSGGERKRTSIALAILRGPTVLFLDGGLNCCILEREKKITRAECTSGLDSFQAVRVVTTIKNLASKSNRTVVVRWCVVQSPLTLKM